MGVRKLFAEAYVDEVKLFDDVKNVVENSNDNQLMEQINEREDFHQKTALMYSYIERKNREFIDTIDSYPEQKKIENKNLKILVIPGMFHKEHPEVGARGDIICDIAKRCGLDASIIMVSSKGSVAGNVDVIMEAISHEDDGKDIWIVSFSKGSTEVRHVLERVTTTQIGNRIKGWISISGMPFGSPLGTLKRGDFLSRLIWILTSKTLGVETKISQEMDYENDKLSTFINVPKNLSIIHIVGFPLPSHLHPELIKFYNRLKPYGPSDGLTLLSDYMTTNGHVYPMWGLDHFLRTSTISSLIYKMCHFINNQK